MKNKLFPTAVLSSSFLASIGLCQAGEYQVKKGDTLTALVQKYSRASDDLNYSQMLALIMRLNDIENLSDYDYLKIGQKIRVPEPEDEVAYLDHYRSKYPAYWNPSEWKVKADRKYVVRPGDSLSKIAMRLMPEVPLLGDRGSLKFLLDRNESIRDQNKIFAGQEIVVPGEREIAEFEGRLEFKRLPAAQEDKEEDVLEDWFPEASLDIPLIERECGNITQLNTYKELNHKLLACRDRISTLRSLKDLINISENFGHQKSINFFTELTSTFLKRDQEERFLRVLKDYYIKNYS